MMNMSIQRYHKFKDSNTYFPFLIISQRIIYLWKQGFRRGLEDQWTNPLIHCLAESISLLSPPPREPFRTGCYGFQWWVLHSAWSIPTVLAGVRQWMQPAQIRVNSNLCPRTELWISGNQMGSFSIWCLKAWLKSIIISLPSNNTIHKHHKGLNKFYNK